MALNAVDDNHGDMACNQREEQPAEFAVHHVAEVGHPFDFFRRPLHHLDAEYFQRAAAATVLADHADNGNGKHEDVKGKVAGFGGKAIGGRTFGRIEQSPNNAHDNHQQRDETDGFVHAEECADPFFAVINGPDGDGGQDADETEYGQPVQCARDGIVGLGACSGHNVSLFLIYLIF